MIADPEKPTPSFRKTEAIGKRTLAGLHVEEAVCVLLRCIILHDVSSRSLFIRSAGPFSNCVTVSCPKK